MNRETKFLKHLTSIGADLEHKDVTKTLAKLGLKTEDHIYDFLNSLASKKYVEWYDNRPHLPNRSPDIIFIGGSPDEKAPFFFTAKLLLAGSDYLDDRNIKTQSNKGTYISAATAIIFGTISAFLGVSSNTKDKEIETLKNNLLSTNSRLDSVLSDNKILSTELVKTKQSLAVQLAKRPTTAGAAPGRHPLDAQRRQNRTRPPNNLWN